MRRFGGLLLLALVCGATADDLLEDFWRRYFPPVPEVERGLQESLAPPRRTRVTLFYFFSLGMPSASWKGVFKAAERLEGRVRFYGVLRGMDRQVRQDLVAARRQDGSLRFDIRIHPIMFRDLNITRVPVFVLAACEESDRFRHAGCRYLYRFDGDVPLPYALARMGDLNASVAALSELFSGGI